MAQQVIRFGIKSKNVTPAAVRHDPTTTKKGALLASYKIKQS